MQDQSKVRGSMRLDELEQVALAERSTGQCAVSNHHRCKGRRLTVEYGWASCECPCHARDDDRVDDAKVWGEVA